MILLAAILGVSCAAEAPTYVMEQTERYTESIQLPDPATVGSVPLETAFSERRSARDYSSEPLPIETIGQLFWAGQGITDDAGHRTAPSAGALYPLELYAITTEAVMHYLPASHRVEQRPDSTTLAQLTAAAFDQAFVGAAPTVLVITGTESRTEAKYGAVAADLVNRESGHAAQNILLQATALGLAAVPVGGFDPAAIERLLALSPGEQVLYLIPIGYPTVAADG